MRRRSLLLLSVVLALTCMLAPAAVAAPGESRGPVYDEYESDAYWANLQDHRDAIEWEMVDLINHSRARHGLAPLVVQDDIRQVARRWSAHMREHGQYHNPNMGREIGEDQGVGENIWGKQHGGTRVMHAGFMDSPGHRANILNARWDEVGVGLVFEPTERTWWVTVNFRDRRPGTRPDAPPARPAARPEGRAYGVVPVRGAIAGSDRVDTALHLAGHFDQADEVVLARSDEFADALAGGPLAASVGGPLLLTGPDGLDGRVADELDRLGTTTVHLLGGVAALPARVARQLEGRGMSVVRHAGADRFATAAAIAKATAGEDVPGRVMVADGAAGWPDALAASAKAAADGVPLLLVGGGKVPAATAETLAGWAADGYGPAVTVVGGTLVVSGDQVDELDAANGDAPVFREAGEDRYATSARVAGVPASPTSVSWSGRDETFPVWVATGRNWPDALAAGPAAARAGARLVLVDGGGLASSRASVVGLADHLHLLESVTPIGGLAAIDGAALAALRARMR